MPFFNSTWPRDAMGSQLYDRQLYDGYFFCFQPEIPFFQNLFRKIKIVSWSRNLVHKLIRISRIQWWCSLFCFRPEILFLGKFGPKNQNDQFKVKLDTWTNSNMQNSMGMFTFLFSAKKYSFWTHLVQNVKIISLRWNW